MKSINDAKGARGILELVTAELKKRVMPVTLVRSIHSLLPLLNTGCRRDAIVLIRALKDVDESLIKVANAVKSLQKSIDRDVRRLEAIAQDELLRQEKVNESKDIR